MHGYGEFTKPYGRKFVYKGQYNEGKREGLGEIDFLDQRVYQGQWLNDLKHGTGKFYSRIGVKNIRFENDVKVPLYNSDNN